MLIALIIATYAFQIATAFTATTSMAVRSAGAMFVMIFFAIGIARSRELLGLRGGGLLDFLVARAHPAAGEPNGPGAGTGPSRAADPGPRPVSDILTSAERRQAGAPAR